MTPKEFYEAINGDYNDALKRMMMDALIIKMLKKFAEKDYLSPIIDAYHSNQIVNVFEAVHTLKGVAGNLSFTPLFNITDTLCYKTRNQANDAKINLDQDIQKLQEEYHKIVGFINQVA